MTADSSAGKKQRGTDFEVESHRLKGILLAEAQREENAILRRVALDFSLYLPNKSIPGSGRSPGEGNGNPLQYDCLENPGQRSLVGYSLWGRKELDTTERLFIAAQILMLDWGRCPDSAGVISRLCTLSAF